jgi:hypothetical protein
MDLFETPLCLESGFGAWSQNGQPSRLTFFE